MTNLRDSAVQVLEQQEIGRLDGLAVKIFADGADRESMLELYKNPYIKGFTTNPTLMRKAGVTDYRAFARDILSVIADRPISFEVFAEDPAEMQRQALEIASWGANVYVKIPVTNSAAEPMYELIRRLSHSGVHVNVTAVMTLDQVRSIASAVEGGEPCVVSMFAGRIADTGRDPQPIMASAVRILASAPDAELLWASPRELLNILHAESAGCHIITITSDILAKLKFLAKDLDEYSLETVRMFNQDASAAGYTL